MSQNFQDQSTMSAVSCCGNHPGNELTFYCTEHGTIGCSECRRLNHRDCSVDDIVKVASDFANGEENTKFTATLTASLERMLERKKTLEDNLQKADEYYSETVKEINQFRKDIEEYVDKMEKTLLNDCLKRKEEAEKAMNDLGEECASVERELASMKNEIVQVNGTVESFVKFKEAQKMFGQLENCMTEIDTKNVVNPIKLSKSSMLNEMIGEEIPIGEIRPSVKPDVEEAMGEEKRTFDNVRLERIGQIRVRMISEAHHCWITGMTCLKKNRLAVVDFNNQSLKVLDVESGNVTDFVKFDHRPRDIAAIYDWQLAVTFVLEKKIQILLQDGLKKVTDIPVEGKCTGIAHNDRLLYVSYTDPSKVEILYIEGDVWQRYTKDNYGRHMFRSPMYIDVAMDDRYQNYAVVTDGRTNTIRKIKLDLKKHRDDSFIGGYNGVVALKDESLLVCAENHRVYHVSADMKRSRELLDDIDDQIAHPDAICLNTETNTVFISNRLPGYQSDNIFMYKLHV